MPKKTKNKFFSISKSKIDWNNKYNFPKKNNPIQKNLFDYSVKTTKLDIMNKNLDKKITNNVSDLSLLEEEEDFFKKVSLKNNF